jgi:aminoglycoside phosphotransferase family enzyme
MKTEIRQLAEELQQPVFSMPTKTIRRLFDTLLKFIMNHMPLFDERVKEGKIIEGHGDLKPAHIKTGPVPAIIDCLEFNVDLRILDAAEDLSGLAMECEHAGNRNVGCYFLKVYELVTGDRVKEALINFYKLKRALLRALLIARHIPEPTYATDSRWSESAQSYLKQAAGYEKNLLAE